MRRPTPQFDPSPAPDPRVRQPVRRPVIQRSPKDGGAEPAATDPHATDVAARFPRAAALAQRASSPAAVRAAVAADRGLAQEIPAYLAAGGDPHLNQLMASAFPATTEGAGGKRKSAKGPTDPTQPLPTPRTGDKTLTKGQMKWTLSADDHSTAHVDIDFKPDPRKVEAKTVSFVQVMIERIGTGLAYPGGTATNPAKKKDVYQPFEEPASKKIVDHFAESENDPFYGAEWDQAGKKWKQERTSWNLGRSKKGGTSTSATMTDTPDAPEARMGLGDVDDQFETVPVVLETREPLGALTWGYKIKDAANSKIELVGGTNADCTDAPSADWAKTLDQFYVGKFATILDNFDINKSDLKPDHTSKLDGIVTTMKADMTLKAQLGGACDLTGDEKLNQALALKRAEVARDYLTGKGVAAARIEVQSYSYDWARVEAERGKSEGKNRRVQVWLHP
jgi:outer membrane protein OmpA-like peptidoglycan-associated protein